MRRMIFGCITALVLLALFSVGCGDKSTGPSESGTKIINQLGPQYYGVYEVKAERGQCGFVSCTWTTLYVDTITICTGEIEFLPVETNADDLFFVDSEDGIISDTLIDVTYKGRSGILTQEGDTCMTKFEMHVSSNYRQEATKEITPDSIQFFVTMSITECGSISVVPVRYTLRRISGC